MSVAINDNFCAHCTPFLATASVHQLGTRPPDMIMRNDVSETNLQAPCTQEIYLGLTVRIDPCLDPLVEIHGTVRLTLATLSEENSVVEESISPREGRHLYVVRNYCSVQSTPSLSLQDPLCPFSDLPDKDSLWQVVILETQMLSFPHVHIFVLCLPCSGFEWHGKVLLCSVVLNRFVITFFLVYIILFYYTWLFDLFSLQSSMMFSKLLICDLHPTPK